MLYVDKPERLLDPFVLEAMCRTQIEDFDCVYFSTDKLLNDLRQKFTEKIPLVIDDTVFAYNLVDFLKNGDFKICDPHTTDPSKVFRTMSSDYFRSKKLWMIFQGYS